MRPQLGVPVLADDVKWLSRVRVWLRRRPEHDQKAVEVEAAKVDSDAAIDRTDRILAGYIDAERTRRTR